MTERYKHVVIIGIDGMGNFNKDTETPRMDALFENGAQTFYGMSLYPTISAQNWGGMLLGCLPEVHGLTNGIVGECEYTNKELPSIFTTVREKYPDAFLCSCVNWEPINHGIIEHDINVEMHTADDDGIVCDRIVEAVSKKPKFLFIQFDQVDGAGHGNDYGTPNHLKQIRKTDEYVGRIYDAYAEAGIANDTLFIELADHGGYHSGHGGYTDGEKYVYFALAGKGVNKCTIDHVETRDINAIVRYAFGIDIPEYNPAGYSSQVPENVFADYKKPYIRTNPVECILKTEATPAIDGENGLYSFIDKNRVKLALFLDSNSNDATGNYKVKEINHVKYYSEGRYGSNGEFGRTGCFSIPDLKFGTDSFTVSFWAKIDKNIPTRYIVCGTKDMSQKGAGFAVNYNLAATEFCVETEGNDSYEESILPYNNEISNGWIHLLFSFDRKKNTVDTYLNFNHKKNMFFPDRFIGFNLDANEFIVGNDASLKCNTQEHNIVFYMDDFIIFGDAFTDADVEKLKAYYKM